MAQPSPQQYHAEAEKDYDVILMSVVNPSGACAGVDVDDLDLFFSSEVYDQLKAIAKFCDNCPVVEECLTSSLVLRYDGAVWGGTTARQRELLLDVVRDRLRQQGNWNKSFPFTPDYYLVLADVISNRDSILAASKKVAKQTLKAEAELRG